MDTTPTNSSPTTESTQSAPAQTSTTTSAPATQSPINSPAKQSPWAGMPPPEWTKATGIDKIHEKTEPAVPTQTQSTTTTSQPVTTQPASTTATTTATTPPPVAFDQKAFAQTLAEALRPPAQQSGTPQFTDAEIRQQLNVFEASDADYEELLGVKPDTPARTAALNRLLQGVARQAVTMANVMNNRALQQYQESLNPYITSVRSQEANRQKELFFKENQELVGYEPMVETEFQLALKSGMNFPNVDAARKYVADKTRDKLKAVGIVPTAKSPQSTSTTTTPNTSVRTMTPTSVGGRSGVSATGKPASTVEAVWGNRK